MPTMKQNLINGIDQTLLCATDSRGRPEPGRWTRLLPGLIGAALPNIKIILKERNPTVGLVVTTLQSGAPGGATLTVIVDAAVGATTYRFDNTANTIGIEPAHEMIVLFGVNDAKSYYRDGNPQYHPQWTQVNYQFLCNWMYQTYGTKAHLMTDGWYGTDLFQKDWDLSPFRAAIRRASRHVQGPCDLIETGNYFEDNYNGTGYAGQGGFFVPDDTVHWTASAEPGIAALCMPALGF